MKRRIVNVPDRDKYGIKEDYYKVRKDDYVTEYDESEFDEFIHTVFAIDVKEENNWFITCEQFTKEYHDYLGMKYIGVKTAIKELFNYSEKHYECIKKSVKRIKYINEKGELSSKTVRVILNMKLVLDDDTINSDTYKNALQYEKELKGLMIRIATNKELKLNMEKFTEAYRSLKSKIDELEIRNGTKTAC